MEGDTNPKSYDQPRRKREYQLIHTLLNVNISNSRNILQQSCDYLILSSILKLSQALISQAYQTKQEQSA